MNQKASNAKSESNQTDTKSPELRDKSANAASASNAASNAASDGVHFSDEPVKNEGGEGDLHRDRWTPDEKSKESKSFTVRKK